MGRPITSEEQPLERARAGASISLAGVATSCWTDELAFHSNRREGREHHVGDLLRRNWRTLFACGLIKREGSGNFIALTPRGLHWQQRIAHSMAQVAGLHILMPHGEDRFNVICRCTCGWNAALSKNQGHVISGQFRHFGQHIDAVRKGMWKKPRSVEEVFEASMARREAAHA